MKLIARGFRLYKAEAFSCHSREMGQSYDITVGLPASYGEKQGRQYPLLLVLDGNLNFSTAHLYARGFVEEIEELIVVGIDIPVELDDAAYTLRRAHQFSPDNEWDMTDPFGEWVKDCLEQCIKDGRPVEDYIGGAPDFLSFLANELIPVLSEYYDVAPGQYCLSGSSAAGFFASYVLLSDAPLFSSYIISSPAMAYGDGEIYRMEARRAATGKKFQASVYMGAGGLELNHLLYGGLGQNVSGMCTLTGALLAREYREFRLKSEIFEGIGHIDSYAATLSRGLRWLFR